MTSPLQPSTLDGLPRQFVTAMRTLFDIMDDKKSGSVNFSDIENRWQDDNAKGLPKGVMESLRKVTPPNGMLSFERFCAGLKICLLRNQVERRDNIKGDKEDNLKPGRPPSAPLLDADNPPKPAWGQNIQNNGNTAAIRPNNVLPQQRALSMPQLLPERQDDKQAPKANKPVLYGPPKPPRTALGAGQSGTGNLDRAEIRTALQNWQMGLMMNDQENKAEKRQQHAVGGLLRTGRSMGDGKAAGQSEAQAVAYSAYQKKAGSRRREPRRHTLQNGIDYNMLKRMKQIEQEKEVLLQGLSAVEKARDWYLKQVAAVQEKMKCLGRMGHLEHWSEAQQERFELQRARVLEVNRHLAALTESWERGGLPLHMNLAVHHYPQSQHPQDLSDRLKRQNRLLTEEVSKKSERISALEREKASLIQVLQMRSAPQSRSNGQTEEAVF